MVKRQQNIVAKVKDEVRARIEAGEDPGPVPEVVMDKVT